ncbi:MAG: phosphate ABC transporter permease PstA [Anaerolineaceae bacterium]|nr:MAG: phosphate ABC transporter, permease protein PstA [Chloroflexi bacterium HGW-Chloroflexi-8]
MKKKIHRRYLAEFVARVLMIGSFALVALILGLILWTLIQKGLPSLTWEMVSQTPKGGFYLGKEGGILNAILGSLYMAGGGTLIALIFSLPIAIYLNTYLGSSRWGNYVRLVLDILWGIPSIVYGAFGFIIMLSMGMRASLLGGTITLTLLALPIMTRAMDEVIRRMPTDLSEAALALGSTRLEIALRVTLPQMLPGILTAVLLAFGRVIGDAASVLFTAGYTDNIPTTLFRPVASLPLAVFFQLGTPFPEVQQRAYASALILTILVLILSIGSRLISSRLNKYTIK